jgi:hypothetical protein
MNEAAGLALKIVIWVKYRPLWLQFAPFMLHFFSRSQTYSLIRNLFPAALLRQHNENTKLLDNGT